MNDLPMELNCQEVVELLSDYIDGDLDGDTREGLEQHLEDCVPCHRYLRELRATIHLTGQMQLQEMPAVMRQRLHDFLATRINKQS